MSRIVPSRQHPLVQTARPPAASSISRRPLQKSELWIELTHQLALHLVSLSASLTADGEPEVCSDLADQAAIEFEQDLAMQVKTRTIDKLPPRRASGSLRLALPARRRDKPRATTSLRRPPCNGSAVYLVIS
jgi:hypothetical protein